MRAEVPETGDPELRLLARTVRETLEHHARLLSAALDLLGDLRPERTQDLIDSLNGLGPPAQRLCALQAELGASG